MTALKAISKSSYTQEILERDLALTATKAGVYSGPIPVRDPRVSSALMELFMGLLALNAMREINSREKMVFYVANWKARHKATGVFNPADFAVHDPSKIVNLLCTENTHEDCPGYREASGGQSRSVPAHWTL